MATTPIKSVKPENEASDSARDLEADIQQLKEDLAKLTSQLSAARGLSYGAAKRAASEGADRLIVEGEAALESMRANARDIEQQMVERVREKPFTALAIAAGVGFLFAVVTRR